jgi:hypothetical protein
MTALDVNWDWRPHDAVALVLLPWERRGTTIGKQALTGVVYGARDVTFGPDHDSIVAAWISDAKNKQLVVRDLR